MTEQSGMSDNEIWVYCDRCGEKIYNPNKDNSVDEDGLVYCISCFEKLVEKGEC